VPPGAVSSSVVAERVLHVVNSTMLFVRRVVVQQLYLLCLAKIVQFIVVIVSRLSALHAVLVKRATAIVLVMVVRTTTAVGAMVVAIMAVVEIAVVVATVAALTGIVIVAIIAGMTAGRSNLSLSQAYSRRTAMRQEGNSIGGLPSSFCSSFPFLSFSLSICYTNVG
jgi:hypothetical protein